MRQLIRDYTLLNAKRIRKDFLTILVGAFLLEYGYGLFWRWKTVGVGEIFVVVLTIVLGTIVLVASVVFVLHLLTALSVVWLEAKNANLSMKEYLASERYRAIGRAKLNQGAGYKIW